jgi:hypothetical protein
MKTPVFQSQIFVASAILTIAATHAAEAATVVLYDQDFESPTGFVDDGGDINIFREVNLLYGNQPAGFAFAQNFTTETLNVTGTDAFGVGYSDPSGKAGDYAIGLLSSAQDDRLGLSFDVGTFPFFNLSIDISSIDLDRFGGPFVPGGAAGIPEFQFTLFDNPTGVRTIGSGTILDQKTLTGTASAQTVFDFTSDVLALSTVGNTNGYVTLQIDLLTGGYGAFDNLKIAASDDAGDTGGPPAVPVPAAFPLLLAGIGSLGFLARRRRK